MLAAPRRCAGERVRPLLVQALSGSKYGEASFDPFGSDKGRGLTSLAVQSNVVAKGPGGRSSVSGVVATVFGATGFLGRYVVQQLARTGSQVHVPYRGNDDDTRHLKLMGDLGQVVPQRFNIRDDDSIAAVMAKSNVIINLLGRDFETRNFSFEDINVTAAEKIARMASEHSGVARYVQMSCLGASPYAPSKQHRTKATGEAAAFKAFPQATIMRAGPLVGTEDRLLNYWAIKAKTRPAVPVIGGGTTLLQPVHVLDVASAITAAVQDDGRSAGNTYELGGPEVLSVLDMVNLMFETIRETPRIVDIPFPVAKMMATPRELLLRRLPFPIPAPAMATLDYINSLTMDQVVDPMALTFADLGIVPVPLRGVAIEYLFSYRAGGPQYGETVGQRTTGAGF